MPLMRDQVVLDSVKGIVKDSRVLDVCQGVRSGWIFSLLNCEFVYLLTCIDIEEPRSLIGKSKVAAAWLVPAAGDP